MWSHFSPLQEDGARVARDTFLTSDLVPELSVTCICTKGRAVENPLARVVHRVSSNPVVLTGPYDSAFSSVPDSERYLQQMRANVLGWGIVITRFDVDPIAGLADLDGEACANIST